MTDRQPDVSIVIPAYSAVFFEQALKSALAQTYPHVEVVVCDDSPGDRIRGCVETLHDRRIRYLRNRRNLGLAGNFTHGYRSAHGRFIKFLNDDDVLQPRCVERLLAGFTDHGNGITLVTSKRRMIDAFG